MLRFMGVSVMIGYEVNDGKVKAKSNMQFYYDNKFTDTKHYDRDGSEWTMPKGKFRISNNKD